MVYIFSLLYWPRWCRVFYKRTASFVENFTENLGNTTWVSFTVVIKILRVKQILRANRNSYFYIGNIAKMLTASPNNGVTV